MGRQKLKILAILAIVPFFFSWGFLTAYKEIFPYKLLKKVGVSDSSIYKDIDTFNDDKYWVEELSKGGYIIHLRHAQREKWTDVTAFDAWELSENIKAEDSSFHKAVCLTDQGDQEAELIGNIFNKANIRISEVISSPSCRARETAVLAFGEINRISNSLLHRTAMTVEQHNAMTAQLRKIIDEVSLEPGKNVVLSGHGGTLSNNIDLLIDVNKVGELDDRDETGFIILSRNGDKVIAEYKYKSIWHFANAFIEFEIN